MKRAPLEIALNRRTVVIGAAAASAAVVLPQAASAAEPVEIVEGGGGAQTCSIEQMSYKSPALQIKAGESVTWTNNDDIAHNVHLRNGPAKGKPYAQGKMLNKGESYTIKFVEAGEYSYVCTPHPMMKGKVTVA